jgi:hypothetical protein
LNQSFTLLRNIEKKGKIELNFVAFSQYLNINLVRGFQSVSKKYLNSRNESCEPESELDEWCTLQGYVKVRPVLAPMNNVNPTFDRTPWVFGYPKVLPYSPSQDCALCGKSGSKRCSKCKEWYCSQVCQINDWPRHKSSCVEPPPLENSDG